MNQDVQEMIIIVAWGAAAALLFFDGLFDTLLIPTTQALDVGELIVGVALATLLIRWIKNKEGGDKNGVKI